LQDLEEVEDGKEGRFATSWKIMIILFINFEEGQGIDGEMICDSQ